MIPPTAPRSTAQPLVWRSLALALGIAVAPASLAAQADMPPVNDLPNPYRTIEGWAKMPDGRTWGATSAVAIDRDGVSLWVGERCGANSCLNSNLPSILKFDSTGRLVKSFGAGMLIFPHGIHVDFEGNIWVTDGQDNLPRPQRGAPPDAPLPPPPSRVVGHNVYKFSPDGELLMTLGKPGGARDPEFFFQPNDVLVAPNGNIFVAEGHSSAATGHARILKFDRTGRLLRSFGTKGDGVGQFDQPHALAMDSRGRLFVGDRSNNRIVIYDQDFNLLDTWYQFSRASGIFIDRNDMIYVADSESGSVGNGRTRTWKRGIRIGSARDGRVTAFIPDPEPSPPSTSSAEGVAVDRNGVIYGAEVGQRALKRYERAGEPAPQPSQQMSFFITSEGLGAGANLGGLEGADRHCAALAERAGVRDKTWRAYLSVVAKDGRPAVNARDRIGSGPWYNAKGELIASSVADLHSDRANLSRTASLNEKGGVVNGRGDSPNQHDILTGALADGSVSTDAGDTTCNNWTSNAADGAALVGHHDRQGGGAAPTSWNSAHPSRGCGQQNLQASGGAGLFMCFAR